MLANTATAPRLQYQRYFDLSLLHGFILLLGFGLVMMTSASLGIGNKLSDDTLYFFKRQVIFIFIGLLLAAAVYRVRMVTWQDLGLKILPITLLLLLAVVVPIIGTEVKGARRWISLPGFSIQVSEIVKLAVILYFASYMSRHSKRMIKEKSWTPIIIPLVLMIVLDGLLMLEPDFGASVVISATVMAMLFLGGIPFTRLALIFLIAVGFLVPFLMFGYRAERITAYLDVWAHATGKGYQTAQALVAIGDGGWFGNGLGGGVQKLFHLPEAHNDFVFAVIAEELGLMGVLITLGLYGWLFKSIMRIGTEADKVKHHFSAYVAYGITFWLAFQMIFHIGVNVGLLPPKGLTLPLISYGGSSMVVGIVAIAIVMRIHRDTQISLYGTNAKEDAQ